MHPSRQIDVVIALENTRDPGLEQNLRWADSYARENGYAWPEMPEVLPRSIFTSDVVTRFRPKDPEASIAPELVYFPLIKTPNCDHDDFDPVTHNDASTFNFTVPWLSYELLWNTMRRNVGSKEGVEAIREAIRDAYRRKKARRLAKKLFGIF